MSDEPAFPWRTTLATSVVAGLVFIGVMYPIRLVLGSDPFEAFIAAAVSGVGVAGSLILVARLSRNPESFYAVAERLRPAIRTGRVPEDVDAARWLEVITRQRQVESALGVITPVLLMAMALFLWFLGAASEDDAFLRIVSGALAVGAVAAPFGIRWELRKMDVVVRQLRERLSS